MKKLLFGLLFLAGALSINAQSVKFGVKGGLNFATLRGNNLDVDSKTGFHLGGVVELKFLDKFSVQPELLYTELGTKNSNGELKLDYISLPVMAKYYVLDGFFAEAGPQFSFLVRDELDVTGGALDPQTEDFDLGLNLGLGYSFKNGLFIQSRYTLGLTALQENPDVRNGAFQLSLGYLF